MRAIVLFLFALASLQAQGLQLLLHTPGSSNDGTVVGSTFPFSDTSLGDASTVTFRLKNVSSSQVFLVRAVYSASASFPVNGVLLDKCVAAGSFEDFTVSFTPQAADFETAPLQIGSLSYSSSSGCPSTPPQNVNTSTLTTLQGNGTAATFTVSTSVSGAAAIHSGDTINFGQVTIGVSQPATITLLNATSGPISLPTPSIQSGVFTQSSFSLGPLAALPSSLAPGSSASFTVTFAPTQQTLLMSALVIGSRTYTLSGIGIPGAGLESLLVSYTLPTGVHYSISSASPVDFGSSLTGSSKTFIFTILNPATNFDPQIIPAIALSGSGFSLASLPALPITLRPGDSMTFGVVFSPSQEGTLSGTLSIGSLQFSLTARASAQPLNPEFRFTPQILSSQQQGRLSIQLPQAPQSDTIGALAVSFNSAVTGVSDDPAILFVSTGSRNANAAFKAGANAATFNNRDGSIVFQTGTTAGTFTFTLSFADGEVYKQSVDLVASPIQISSATATRQSPYLVLDLTAFDNTYSASKLLFNFYDAKGVLMTPGGITIDGAADFRRYFFTNNQAGGAFTLQAKFPVAGDITSVTAADVTVQNSSGQSQVKHLNF